MKTKQLLNNALLIGAFAVLVPVLAPWGASLGIVQAGVAVNTPLSAEPVVYWSREAQRAITPPGPGGIFGTENYGNKFPGDAAVYMGIAHVAIYDAALAFGGGYRPYAIGLNAPAGASAPAAIATAAHHTLIGLQPELGLNPAQQALLDGRYAAYLAGIPDGTAKTDGIAIGVQVAAAVVALRANDGRGAHPVYGEPPFVPPPPGPGVWDPGTAPAVGLLLPGMRPLALESASQFRPDGPDALTSNAYARDFQRVKELGRANSTTRTEEQTELALFWTDHNARQWNDGLINMATTRGLDLVQTARMLAMAHVAGGDSLIACWEAKYHYWFWRPHQAIARADTDGNPDTEADATWGPLRAMPNFPEYPSGHSCHTGAITEALRAFFGNNSETFSLDSRITGTARSYNHFQGPVREVVEARVLTGFHFDNSDQDGATLGQRVGRYVVRNFFEPVR